MATYEQGLLGPLNGKVGIPLDRIGMISILCLTGTEYSNSRYCEGI